MSDSAVKPLNELTRWEELPNEAIIHIFSLLPGAGASAFNWNMHHECFQEKEKFKLLICVQLGKSHTWNR